MRFFTDLHNHSKYSRATSIKMDLENQSHWAKIKGVNLIGSSDFTHPLWLNNLKEKLKLVSDGIYEFQGVNWLLTSEIANICSVENPKNGIRTKRMHHIMVAPSFDVVDQINELLDTKGRRDYDGRPIFGKYPSEQLVEDLMNISKKILVIPAHVWTPWFSLFGSNSGYDSLKDCYGKQTKNIHAIETGLSSDPLMNWRVSNLDGITLVSNSDSHSPWPWRFGRECNVIEMEDVTYENLYNAIVNRKNFEFTIEVDPNYGKYHLDGHRNCGVSMYPNESNKQNQICPKCSRKLTIGVLNRAEELADRKEGFIPENSQKFKTLLPLHEIIRTILGLANVDTKTVWNVYNKMIEKFGTEFNILLDVSKEELSKNMDKKFADGIIQNREGKIKVIPGYDGKYGVPVISEEEQQKNLVDF